MLREIWKELLGVARDPASLASLSRGARLALGLLLAVGVHTVVRKVRGRKRRYQDPPDTVVLVCGPRGPFAPSLVPFAVKLETYCRMAGIPYQPDCSWTKSSKGKLPWLRYNGEEVADSSFCIQFLSHLFSKDLNSGLTSEQRAVGRAFTKMLEENTYWTMVVERWLFNQEFWKELVTAWWQFPLIFLFNKWSKGRLAKMAWAQGMGRHSRQEVELIMDADLKAVSDFLGDKDFLFGSEPCEADCAVFGQLSQFLWHMPGMHGERLVTEKYPNLQVYCLRLQQRYWPDWDRVVPRARHV